MKKLLSILKLSILMATPFVWGQDTVTDIDGNVYQTVQIGEQLWMKENLKVTHYNNGDEIPTGYSNDEWANLSTGAYAVYDDNESNADTYGYLYNWYAVDDDRGVCPASWHVPTDGEYTALSDYLGGTSVAGGKLKECTEGSCPESEYWYSPNTGATNESGFTALPGGAHYYYYGNGRHMGYNGSFWSSTEYGSNDAWHRGLDHDYSEISRRDYGKDSGFSVRCVRDDTEIVTILNQNLTIPQSFALHQNYPNPFNPTTTLKYDLPEDAMVNITIYDMMGRIVKTMVNTQQNAGYKSIQWNATNDYGKPVSAGLYLYTIEAGAFRQTKKMVLLK